MSATVLQSPQWNNEFESKKHAESSTTDSWTNDVLPEFVRSIAKIELREEEKDKEKYLELFRDWITKYSEVKNVNTDANFLLRFLRSKKYSLPLAQNMLLKYLNLRQNFPSYFKNLDFLSTGVNQLINSGYLIPSPKRDKLGRRVIFGFAENLSKQKYNNIDLVKAHIITYETLLCDEINQVAGVVHYGDCQGSPPASVALSLFNPREFFLLLRWGEHSLPMRHRETHFVNVSTPVKYIFEFFQSTLTEQMRDRIKLHSSLDEVKKHIDIKLFPKEYGGVIPMAEMIEIWKKELLEKREQLLALDKMELLNDVDVCLRKQKATTSKESNDMNITGTFRKLEID